MDRQQRIQKIRDRANEIGRSLAEYEEMIIRHARKHGYDISRRVRHVAYRKASIIRRVKPLVDSLGK